jgi:hypothetical protein
MAAIVLSGLSLILTGRATVSLRDKARQTVSNVGRAILLTFVIIYLLIDLIFLSIMRPLRRRLLALPWLRNFRTEIGSLNRYSALLLLLVPWLILEPLKPLSIVLFTHKHHLSATLLMVGGEVIKLTLLEQIFDVTKPKLLTFGWFAWGYGKWRENVDYIHSLAVWRSVHDCRRRVVATLRARLIGS